MISTSIYIIGVILAGIGLIAVAAFFIGRLSGSKTAIDAISKERDKQMRKGFTPEYDAAVNDKGQLSYAAMHLISEKCDIRATVPEGWEYQWWFKLHQNSKEDRLKIAGALIAAEYDRLQYLEEAKMAVKK